MPSMKKYAVLDIGTNSIKFIMFSVVNAKVITIMETSNISRLGEDLHKNRLITADAMTRNIEVLRSFMKIAREADVAEITALGTMCLRIAGNSHLFCHKVKKELGLDIKVISGKEEARLSHLAVIANLGKDHKNRVVFDSGGGSTEFLYCGKIADSISLDIGAVQLTQKFLLSDPARIEELLEMQMSIRKTLNDKLAFNNVEHLVGVGGAATTIAAVMHGMQKYDPALIHGSIIFIEEVNRQIDLYSQCSIQNRKNINGLRPERADIILAGTVIVKEVMLFFKINNFTVSDYGLRHGLIYDRYINNVKE